MTGTNAEIGVRHPSMGVPLFDRTVELFDEQDQPVPEGATGELVIRCDPPGAVMDGYWNNPEATRAALRDGWLRTGDLARRDRAGAYYFVGRSKDVIKRSGENVGAEEVEAVLSDHPAVKEVAVIGVPDEYRDEAVMAFVVIVEEGDALTLQQLRAFCTGRLADFKVPTALRVVDELPRGLLGKTDKRALRSLAAADHPLARGTGDN
ncbi:MAG: Long-chain-fatty-acid--CoA ligase [Acidimicrobiaceae bacterium]|nr:Long-chain-fatty-acid--CoA ligase [Acidimicrobiaceae bacterium]